MSQRVQSVERALSLLEEIASSPEPPSVPELAARAGVNRATAWRLMNTLEHFDLAIRDQRTGRYSLGFGVLRLASVADRGALARRVRPLLEEVAERTGGNAFLEVASRGSLVVLDEVRSPSMIQIDVSGVEVPWHCGSLGKLYLASLPDESLEQFLSEPLDAVSHETITDPDELRVEIMNARVSGVAWNYREHRYEWCAISAAIRDHQGRDLAYVNSTLSSFAVSKEELLAFAPFMREVADRMTSLLSGFRQMDAQ